MPLMPVGERPNIVFILADDMGYGDLSCLNGDSRIHTPHMDEIARQGMRFTDAHASSSVCSPSRYGILTGRYAWRGKLQRGVLGPLEAPLIGDDTLTLPQFLQTHGYHTSCVGKWHLGMSWPFRTPRTIDGMGWSSPELLEAAADIDFDQPIADGPTARGFDDYFGVDVPNFPPYCFIEDEHTVGTPAVPKPDGMFGTPGPMLRGWDLEQILPELTRRATTCIANRAADERPFFLYFSSTAPHTPIAPVAEFRGKSRAGIYGDFVMQLDDTIGRIDAALEEHGLAENTLLIVTSDNGSPGRNGSLEAPGTCTEMFGHNPSWILRGMKADTWDGGHRIPLLAKWPGQISAGSTCDQLVCLMDTMATCAAIVGQDLPAGSAEDSLNILPYLLGQETEQPIRRELVHHGSKGLYGIRRDDWKLIMGQGSGGFSPDPATTVYDPPQQLYNMRADIRERTNLYFERPDIVCELTEVFARHRLPAAHHPTG